MMVTLLFFSSESSEKLEACHLFFCSLKFTVFNDKLCYPIPNSYNLNLHKTSLKAPAGFSNVFSPAIFNKN